MKHNIAIEVSSLSKCYQIGNKKGSIRDTVRLWTSAENRKKTSDFWAVNDLSFTIDKGDVVGLVGKNGAGKSTLLKLLSRITKPTTGRIEIHGRVSSLLEVGTGFHPELTGRENVFLNGTILGMKRSEIKKKFDEIIDFSGIEKFIDTPSKYYSSGMYVRLAFAVAAYLEPEILIIDEILAVGDAEFQKKCLNKMDDVSRQEGRTILFVSHNMAAVKKLCNTGILLQNGKMEAQGPIDKIITSYLSLGANGNVFEPEYPKKDIDIAFQRIEVLNSNNNPTADFTCDEEIQIRFSMSIHKANFDYSLFVMVIDQFGVPVFPSEIKIERETYTLRINKNFLTRGSYSLHAFIHIPMVRQIDVAEDVCQFSITDTSSPLSIHGDYHYGSVFGNCTWH